MTEEHVSARLRIIGRDLQSKLKEFFDQSLGADARPLELLQAALDEVERRIQPAGRGRRTFPYTRVVVRMTQHSPDEAAIRAVFRDFDTRLRDRLGELNCEAPDTIGVHLSFEPAEEGAAATVRLECHDDGAAPRSEVSTGTRRPVLHLAVVKGQCAEASYALDEPEIAIGRTAEAIDALGSVRCNHVAFLETRDGVNETVARAHARLRFDERSGHYVLYNESRSNPTAIIRAGRTIRVAPLDPRGVRVQSGDQLQLGRAVLRVSVEATGPR